MPIAAATPASIPSPSSGTLDLGPLSLNAYGLMIALGVVAAIWLTGRRFEQKGIGTREDATAIGLWAVAAGVVGARLYHVITDWERFEGNYDDIPKIWEGGLGIPGGMLAGVLVGIYVARRRGIASSDALAAAAPALPLAQAIGRWGNWFNQELYGRPTDLPWALEIDDEHLLPGYPSGTTFHPTFLYESLWNFGLCGLLLWIDRRYRPTGGQLIAVYAAGYGLGRFWIEGLRIDAADEIGPFRWNQWVALAALVAGVGYLIATWPLGSSAVPVSAAADDVAVTDDGAVTDDDGLDAGDGLDGEGLGGDEGDDPEVTDEHPSPSRTGADDPGAESGPGGHPSPSS
jgi:prolipoprotein diacylglyceryl transferase